MDYTQWLQDRRRTKMAEKSVAELALEQTGGLTLDSNVPIPLKQVRSARTPIYELLEKALVGQSVFIPHGYQGRSEPDALRNYAANIASTSRKKWKDRQFCSTLVEDPQRGKGARIWRTK